MVKINGTRRVFAFRSSYIYTVYISRTVPGLYLHPRPRQPLQLLHIHVVGRDAVDQSGQQHDQPHRVSFLVQAVDQDGALLRDQAAGVCRWKWVWAGRGSVDLEERRR